MLDFVNHYYEVTEENIESLRHMMIEEDIRDYCNDKLDLDFCVQVGYVLGNIATINPKQTGLWQFKRYMDSNELKKVTTELPNMLMTIE